MMPYSLGTEFMFRVCSHVPITFLMGAVIAFAVSVPVFTITPNYDGRYHYHVTS